MVVAPQLPVSLTEALILVFNVILTMAAILMVGLLLAGTLRNVLGNCTSVEQLELTAETRYALKHHYQPVC